MPADGQPGDDGDRMDEAFVENAEDYERPRNTAARISTPLPAQGILEYLRGAGESR